ncbi:hypothetical protein VNO77_03061 [Canavalia gladiata]|uniref:Legume lectin domain-containing protein n=1 Tax=Canavalia gladiata TaxID=3824 RepID=A0AAN9MUU7_CANGL
MSKTQTPFSALFTILCFLLFLHNNVKSDSFSFNFPNFAPAQDLGLAFFGDARPLGGVIQLTRRDETNGTVTFRPHSVGRAVYILPLQLWDNLTGKLASFETEFRFVVDSAGSEIHGDGLSFFITPFNAEPNIPENSDGGYLGLLSRETAFNTYMNKIVAVEFDSFRNDWDPNPVKIGPHVGIDINSIESEKYIEWPINRVPQRSIGKVVVKYDSKVKELSARLRYVEPVVDFTLTLPIDLSTILPEFVRIGFSGATGDMVESHDILSWSFKLHI